jgi:uncharacterized protein (DUF2147 family)
MSSKALVAVAAAIAVLLAWAVPLRAEEPSAVGLWEQSDGKHVGGWFLIFQHGDTYEGALVKMFLKPGEDPNPVCDKCKGDQKGQPTLGLVMIKGMQRNGLLYDNGSILDPRDGSVYHAKMEVTPDGTKLKLRGFLGISLFGKTQVWKRLPDDSLPQSDLPPSLVKYMGSATN